MSYNFILCDVLALQPSITTYGGGGVKAAAGLNNLFYPLHSAHPKLTVLTLGVS